MDKNSPEYKKAMDKTFVIYSLAHLDRIESLLEKVEAYEEIAGNNKVATLFGEIKECLEDYLDAANLITFNDINKKLNRFYEETGEKYEITYLGKEN